MKVLHISAECYPAAKAGGLGDVAGALPKYLRDLGAETAVIIPKYRSKWIYEQSYQHVFHGAIRIAHWTVTFVIEKCENNSLGFPLYVVNVPRLFDRPGIYNDPQTGQNYWDDLERWIVFQQAVLQWLLHSNPYNVFHCHDHHTGLVPFMIKHCPQYRALAHIPTVFTIHNGQYHGAFHWDKTFMMPDFDRDATGLLDWDGMINPLATGIKCCWQLTTVSTGYMEELRAGSSGGLEWLINNERPKSVGIVNGIDTDVWNPQTDPLLGTHLNGNLAHWKANSKAFITQKFHLRGDLPLIIFIGRLVGEKGADLLPNLIHRFLTNGGQATFFILGTGEPAVSDALMRMKSRHLGVFDTALMYNEELSHRLYAGADFLLMPSRVEPCGLNQLYSLRYGTVPIVRGVGGLRDTVKDIAETDGCGIQFDAFNEEEALIALNRAVELYQQSDKFAQLRQYIMQIDHSWEQSAQQYFKIYQNLVARM
jgi:starch synthase